jgi:hypothetical protein
MSSDARLLQPVQSNDDVERALETIAFAARACQVSFLETVS